MSFVKISDLPAATQANATDQLETNQSGTSRRLTVAQVATHVRSGATDTLVTAAGTVSAPSITFSGDTNTGIYSPAADTIAFTEGGVEAMRLDASGNVGIGTTAPSGRLDVRSSASVPAKFFADNFWYTEAIGNAATNGQTGFVSHVRDSSGNFTSFFMFNGAGSGNLLVTSASPLISYTSNTERMRIDAAGRVGIGTSSPGAFLDVASSGASSAGLNIRAFNSTDGVGAGALTIVKFGSTAAPYGAYAANNVGVNSAFTNLLFGTETAHNAIFYTSNVERMRITASGQLGLGTSAPSYRLDIPATGAVAANLGGVLIGANGTDITGDIAGVAVKAAGANPVQLFTNGSERMRLDASGNLGIGTSSPAARLDVNGTVRAGTAGGVSLSIASNSAIRDTTNGGSTMYFDVSTGGASNGAFDFRSSNAFTSRMYISDAGNVGIGTSSPATRLDVSGGITTLRGAALFNTSSTSGTNSSAYIRSANSFSAATAPDYTWWFDDGTGIFHPAGSTLAFSTGAVERARITSGGQFLIGTTSTTQGFVNINGSVSYTIPVSFAGASGNAAWNTNFTSQAIGISLYTSNAVVGSAVYAYSDIRLKDNVQALPAGAGLEFVAAADPVSFTWKTDGTADTGFIAQSLLAKGYGHLVSSVPDGAMEELQHEDGNVSPAGSRFVVRYDSIIPLLTAALKEQQAQIEELKARVAALENK